MKAATRRKKKSDRNVMADAPPHGISAQSFLMVLPRSANKLLKLGRAGECSTRNNDGSQRVSVDIGVLTCGHHSFNGPPCCRGLTMLARADDVLQRNGNALSAKQSAVPAFPDHASRNLANFAAIPPREDGQVERHTAEKRKQVEKCP